jgi:predicted DNA-binding transcriptional regulator AlpA
MNHNCVLRVAQAAQYCGISASYLTKLRLRGDGPAFVRLGRRAVGYRSEDLDQWLASRLVRSTSEYGEVR